MYDIDELVEKISDFYLDYCPYDFLADSPHGTIDSARQDIAVMLSSKDGRKNLVYNLSQIISVNLLPELPFDNSIQEYIDAAEELISLISELN